VDSAVEEDDGAPPGLRRLEMGRLVARAGCDDEAGHALLQQLLNRPHLGIQILVGVDEHDRVSRRPRLVGDAPQCEAEVCVLDVADDDADRVRVPRGHALGDLVGTVAELLAGRQDEGEHLLAHSSVAPEGPRRLGLRDSGSAGDVGDRGLLHWLLSLRHLCIPSEKRD
jgi:hypothetical protein